MGIKSVILVIFISMVAYHIFNVIQWMKFREAIFNHEPGPCKNVKIRNSKCANAHENDKDCDDWAKRGECQANPTWMAEKCAKSCAQCEDPSQILYGSEDFADLGDGQYLISSGIWVGGVYLPNRDPAVYLFDFNKPNDGVTKVKLVWNDEKIQGLNPHGISSWKTSSGKVYVFLVNHDGDELVERFEYRAKDNTLTHLETVSDIQFSFVNSVVPTGERSFYATNFARFPTKPLITVEMLLMLRFGNIVYFDGESATVVASGFFMANGLNMSPDKKYLYMGHTGDMSVETFRITDDHSLEHVHTLELNTLPDNVQVDPNTGDLWLGAFAEPFKFIIYMETPANTNLTSSSRVLRVKTDEGIPTYDIKDVYSNIGDAIKQSSVAVKYKDQLLVGSVYDKAVYCKITYL